MEYDLRKEFPERGKDISHVTKFVLQTLRTKKSKFEPQKVFFCCTNECGINCSILLRM